MGYVAVRKWWQTLPAILQEILAVTAIAILLCSVLRLKAESIRDVLPCHIPSSCVYDEEAAEDIRL